MDADNDRAQQNAAVSAWIISNGADRGIAPRIIRAAKEGRFVLDEFTREMQRRGKALIAASVPAILVAEGIGDMPHAYQWASAHDRVPTDHAYTLLDALTNWAPAIVDAMALPNTTIAIGDFVRVDPSPEDRIVAWHGALAVTIKTSLLPGEDLGAYVLTERNRCSGVDR